MINLIFNKIMIQRQTHFWSAIGCCYMFLGVALGAFGAHALKSYFIQNPDLKEIFHTAVQYQMIHGLALLLTSHAIKENIQLANTSALAFATGTLLFSGSLYSLVFTNIRMFGAITPLGGVCFLLGWLTLAWGYFRHKA